MYVSEKLSTEGAMPFLGNTSKVMGKMLSFVGTPVLMTLLSPMSELRFPSGPWTGYYTYRSVSGKHAMDLTLHFADGRITGDGADVVGLFIIAGHYDATGGECQWTKTYVGAHDVAYTGFREGKGIWGTWDIEGRWRGGFQIWPLGEGEAEELELEEEEPLELAGQEPSAATPSER
jgi:hypothetical protein